MITLLTSNIDKYKDTQAVLSPIEVTHQHIDLDEIQSLDPRAVIEHKLKQAQSINPGIEFLVDDRSLSIESMGGLPGTFVKHFLDTAGKDKLARYALLDGPTKATARCMIGYVSSDGYIQYFVGEIPGTIVLPRGDLGYGWDSIFCPDGYDKTYGELGREVIAKIGHYAKALEQFKVFYVSK